MPVADIIGRAKGDINYGNGRVEKGTKQFMKFWQDHASYPFKSHDAWFVTEDIRWGKFKPTTDIKALVDKVNREDLWREAAPKPLGVAAADIPASLVARQGDLLRRRGASTRKIRPPISRACRSSASKSDHMRRAAQRRPGFFPTTESFCNEHAFGQDRYRSPATLGADKPAAAKVVPIAAEADGDECTCPRDTWQESPQR